MPPPFATHLLALLADVTDPSSLTTGSPTAAIVLAVLAGVASIVTAVGTNSRLRRRRQAEADPELVAFSTDMEDRPSRLRERLTTVETRLNDFAKRNIPERVATLEQQARAHDTALSDVEEQLRLRRAVDVIAESDASPRRQGRPRQGGPRGST